MRPTVFAWCSCVALTAALCPRAGHAQAAGPTTPAPAPTPIAGTAPSPTAPPPIHEDSLAPRGNLWELGIFGGLLFVSDNNALHNPNQPFADFKQPSPEVGLRLSYLPLSFLGLEIEGMGAAGQLKSDNGVSRDGEGAIVWAVRGSLLLQVPTRSVTPFILGGGGRIGIVSDSVGNDSDPELHFGGGLKINLGRTVELRLDGRDTITKQRPAANTAHTLEGLLGFSLVFGRPEHPKDSDGDGIPDLQDICPNEAGVPPDGCPIHDADHDGIPDASDQYPNEAGPAPTGCPVRDSDGDGVPDATDECRDVPGVAPSGCPDTDGDGVLDRDDQCLDVPGVPPNGCPGDSDGDGIPDNKDRCPNQPETKNGFQDDDGCPDEVPTEMKKFTGAIKGIAFELNKADVTPGSRPLLDQAASILNQYPSLKVMIIGHTDNQGSREKNIELSRKRADAVRDYLMTRGVTGSRIETRGEGPDSPVADNRSAAGRAQNRRIEFQIIK